MLRMMKNLESTATLKEILGAIQIPGINMTGITMDVVLKRSHAP